MRERADAGPLIDWRDGQPYSRRYGDVYFARGSGLEETRHVFLDGNDLATRWSGLAPHAQFVIGETGFGTALNFVSAWALWQRVAPPDARLHYVSIECDPLSSDDMARALSLWPELEDYRRTLLAQWSDLLPGWHRFAFDAGRVHLTLVIGDVRSALPQIDIGADAWFLDGFAPAKNPDMWAEDVLRHVARCSLPHATCATYTVAGDVRRSLMQVGFEVEKRKGFGAKREMLRGVLTKPPAPQWRAPWFAPAPAMRERHAAIIGGGIAGAATAVSLAARGWQVDLIERHTQLAAEASANPQAVLHARLSPHDNALGALVAAGLQYTCRTLHRAALERCVAFDSCGVLQLAYDEPEDQRHAKLALLNTPQSLLQRLDRAEASAAAGVDVPFGGLLLPRAGWVDLARWCRALASSAAIETHFAREVVHLSKSNGSWEIADRDGPIARASVVIFASVGLSAINHLPLRSIRGQVTFVPATPASRALRVVVCGEGYVTPERDGTHSVGATHKFRNASTAVVPAEHDENLARLTHLSSTLHAALGERARLSGWAAMRWSTPDYLPLIGPLVDAARFADAYAPLARDATLHVDAPAPWLEGLYVNTAHGSRGSITAPLAAEILAAYLDGEPAPLPRSVMDAVHPSRFLLRDLIRRKPS